MIADVLVLLVVPGFVLTSAGFVLLAARCEAWWDARHARRGTRYRKLLAVAR